MADKDEVEPTEESSAAEPSSPDARADDPQDTASEGSEFDVSDEPETVIERDFAPESEAELTEATSRPIRTGSIRTASADDRPDDAEFDEIVGTAASRTLSRPRARRRREGPRDGWSRSGREQGSPGTPSARAPKGTATGKRDQPEKRERTTPVKFVRESVGELRKVVYPTGQQLINYFVVVLVFVLFVIAYVSLLDLGFGAAIFKIFS